MRWPLVLLVPLTTVAAVTNIRVLGVSNTQAVIAYTAPDSNACTVEVSESSSYSPDVNDVNGTYFSGADLDSRASSVNNGRERIVVIGKRTVATAANSNNYSLALQAATLHYYRITCGSDVATGTFSTKTIPFGSSHGDPPITDATSTTGGVLVPTPVDTRNSVTIDPRTGAALKRVQVSADGVGATNMGSGGNYERCSGLLRSDDTYLCDAFNSSSAGGLYRIHKDTGDATFLGRLTHHDGQSTNQLNPDNIMWSSSDANCFYFNHSNVLWGFVKVCYSGDGSAVVGSASATLTVTSLKTFTAMETELEAFVVANASHYPVAYNASQFASCSVASVHLERGMGVCRNNQDTFGWYFIYDIPSNAIIAVMPTFAQPVARWCVSHSIEQLGDQEGFQATLQNPKDQVLGNGAYTTTLQADINSTDTSIVVSSTCGGDATCANWNDGEPTSATYAPNYLQDVQVGDVFQFCIAVNNCPGTAEYGRITAKADHTHWTISRAARNSAASQTAGKVLRFYCANKPGCAVTNQIQTAALNWDFLTNPYGDSTDMTGVWLTQDVGHTVSRKWQDGSGSMYLAINGAAIAQSGNIIVDRKTIDTADRYIPQSPYFAGAYPPADGTTFQKHPYANSRAPWQSTDVYPYIGSNLMAQGGVAVGGLTKVYRLTTDSYLDGINYKHFVMFGASGTTALRDVSGPSSVLDDSAGKDFTMCKVLLANECVSGSTAGQLYVQIPSLALTTCNSAGSATVDICVGDFPVAGSSAIQTYWNLPNKQGVETSLASTASRSGIASQRTLAGVAKGISYRNNTQFDTVRIFPNGKWALSMRLMPPGATPDYWTEVLKIPPTIFDSVNRATFIPIANKITSVPTGTNNVIVEFGYGENGAPTSLNCTNRAEGCVAVTSTVDETTPFYFASETFSGLSCASGCTPVIPAYPGKVVYYRIKYRDASNNILVTGPTQVLVAQ